MELDQHEFELIRELVYATAGMAFDDHKRSFMQSRIARRLGATGCESPLEYYRFLRYQDSDKVELQQLIELLTTNETYFFREYPQLECFANEALPEITARKIVHGERRLKIWSAACSTGDEAYTLAIIVHACLEQFARWKIDLMGSDIDASVLAFARCAAYSDRAIKDVPDDYLAEYFRVHSGQYHVVDHIKQMVDFQQLNLLDRRAMRSQTGFDAIFCRNALIYFDDLARRKVLSSFYDALTPGGFLFLGHSESVGRISAAFEMISLGGHITYRRPLDLTPSTSTSLGESRCAMK